MKKPKIKIQELHQKRAAILRHYLVIAEIHAAHKQQLADQGKDKPQR